jgi:hypothetical protein
MYKKVTYDPEWWRLISEYRMWSITGQPAVVIIRKDAGPIPDKIIGFFNWRNPSSRNMAPGSAQPLREMSTRNLPGGNGQPACKADNLTAICEPIVHNMWQPRRLTTIWASMAYYRDNFTFLFI